MPEFKLPTKVGTVVVAIGGITASITADTAREWFELLAQFSPLVLSGWLIYIVYLMDLERQELRAELTLLKIKVARIDSDAALAEQIHAKLDKLREEGFI